jgi:uncharacterized protein YggE
VRDLALLPRALEAAIAAEPDTFGDVAFSIREPAAARRLAREQAIADALDKARVYVEGAGHGLGRLLLVEEGAPMIRNIAVDRIRADDIGSFPDTNLAEAAQRLSSQAMPLVAPQPQRYVAEVSVVFEIGAALPQR